MNQLLATGCQLPCRGRALAVPAILFIASLQGVARECTAQGPTVPPQAKYLTHDWTEPVGSGGESRDFREFWADVKTAGDGYAYAVGTIEVERTLTPAFFSSVAASDSAPPGFFLTGGPTRQVVILQKTCAVEVPGVGPAQTIVAQKFFHGATSGLSNNTRATNARGISVWPAANPADTRVVICGETFDQSSPQSQDASGFVPASGNNATGFLAVYDGTLNLLWTHHFFGTSPLGASAVTDVSVRVVEDGTRDVITYCGISTFGSPAGGNAWLTPVRPFAAPATTCGSGSRAWANGSTDNGVGQWDGFVGRLSRDHAYTTATVTDFHSVVGGSQQDALFGISELEDDHFAVVGSSAGTATSAGLACPGVCVLSTDPQYCVGSVMVFDASGVPGGSGLILRSATMVGQPGALRTILRDVLAQPRSFIANGTNPIDDTVLVVGSTEDGGLAGNPGIVQTSFAGPTDGVIGVFGYSSGPTGLFPYTFEYQGYHGKSGYTGINAWNEFLDHAVVTGFCEQAGLPGVNDIEVSSYYFYPASTSYPNNPSGGFGLFQLTQCLLAGSDDDRPTAMGLQEVTQGGATPPLLTFTLGNHAGGGVAQDSKGRVQAVGTTRSLDFPTLGTASIPARPRSTVLPTPGLSTIEDGVRAVLDLLPANVGRTDGTGAAPSLAGLSFPLPGTNGGTTPPCDLRPFGIQIGEPAPAQRRLLIDYDGPPPSGGVSAGIVVTRTPSAAGLTLAALQIGFPGIPGSFLPLLINSSEVWVPLPAAVYTYISIPNSPLHELLVLPSGPAQFTVQVAFLLSTPVTGGNPEWGVPCGGAEFVVVSPALLLDY
jgi:hypothetical protein